MAVSRKGKRIQLYNLLIVGKRLRVHSSANASVYMLAEIDQPMPANILCDGLERKVKVVLKVYARVQERDLKKQRERRRYQTLLKGRYDWTVSNPFSSDDNDGS